MSVCCNAASGRKSHRAVRGVREILAWILPGIALVFLPKCPACLAAYVALWTGLGISFATAAYLRWAWLFLCIGAPLMLVIIRLRSQFANYHNFNDMETDQ